MAHEYGHSIGLGHSNVNGDLMCGAPENGTCGISNTGLNGVNAADRDANSQMYETLTGNEVLGVGQQTRSANVQYRLIFQSDGNLVLYSGGRNGGTYAGWQSGTCCFGPNRATMQGDGNLVIYSNNNLPICSSRTQNNPGAYLRVQSDGNLVIYNWNNQPIWAKSWGSQCWLL